VQNRVLWQERDGIGQITINRSEALNALNADLLNELSTVLIEHARDTSLKALVVTGAGRAFVAGADIASMSTLEPREAKLFALRGQEVMQQLADFPVPVIAAINGFALGGGLELALACDIRLGSTKAKLGQPEITLGITPGFAATIRLSRVVGQSKAKELLFTGRVIGADEALEIGLLDKVYEPDALLLAAYELAATIAKYSGATLRLLKSAVNAVHPTMGTFEAEMFARCFATEDQKEGMIAFLEKRPARFKNC